MNIELCDLIKKTSEIHEDSEDYTGEDGLLYCGKCHTPKESYFIGENSLWGRDRHPRECDCQRAAREEQEAAEEARNRRRRVERLKEDGFTDAAMMEWTFANDSGKCRQMHRARIRRALGRNAAGKYRLALVGKGRNREKFLRRLHRKCTHGTGNPGTHDEFCADTERPFFRDKRQERIHPPALQLPAADPG